MATDTEDYGANSLTDYYLFAWTKRCYCRQFKCKVFV